MRKSMLILSCCYLFAFLTSCGKRDVNDLPSFSLLLIDSSTVFNSSKIPEGEPTLLMYFSPDCEHCHYTTQEMIRKMDSLKQVQIYLLTPMPYDQLKGFYQHYRLEKYRNITVGNDYELSFYRTFKPSSIPYMVIYDKHRKFQKEYKKGATVSDIIKIVNKES